MTRIDHFPVLAGLEIHVAEWGADNAETVVLWHGLARTGTDFAPLAAALADRFRVLAPDTPGRGLSQWATDADAQYSFALYERVAEEMCRHFGVDRMRWVGTSMGGALGIRLAGGAWRERISHLVVNDIGPELPAPALERILTYVGNPPDFATLAELEAYLRTVYTPYGWLPDAQWREMTLSSWRRRDDGRVTLHYDPRIVRQFVAHADDFHQWDAWTAIAAPTLVLRGEASDLLLPDMAARMTALRPATRLIEVPGCGHAPALNVETQVGPLRAFWEG